MVEEVAIPVVQRMVKGEILEEHVLVEVSEIVVEDGDPNPWGSGHKIDQGGNVSSLSNRDGKLWVKECCMRKAAIKEEQLVSRHKSAKKFKRPKTSTRSNLEHFTFSENRRQRWEVEIAHQSKFYTVRSPVRSRRSFASIFLLELFPSAFAVVF